MTHRPLTPIQKAALLVIRNRATASEPGPTERELAEAIGVSKTRATTILERLERVGAVAWPRKDGRRIARMARAV